MLEFMTFELANTYTRSSGSVSVCDSTSNILSISSISLRTKGKCRIFVNIQPNGGIRCHNCCTPKAEKQFSVSTRTIPAKTKVPYLKTKCVRNIVENKRMDGSNKYT